MEKERALPLSASQRLKLLNLIKKREQAIQGKSSGVRALEKKKAAWEMVTEEFHSMYPDQPPRTLKQLQRCFEHIKRRVKEKDSEYKKKLKTTGGGHPPKPPEQSEEMVLAASMMSEELVMGGDVYDTMDMEFGDVDGSGISSLDVEEISVEQSGSPAYIFTEPRSTLSTVGTLAVQTSGILTTTCSATHPIDFHSYAATSSNTSFLSPPTTPSPTPCTSSAPQTTASCSKARKHIQEDYATFNRRQDELHALKITMMKEAHEWQRETHEWQRETHEWERQAHEEKMKMYSTCMSRLLSSFDNLDSFLESAKTAYDAMTHSYE